MKLGMALCNHFECETLANKLFLKKQYFWLEMKEGISMEAYLKHMKEIPNRVAAIGAPISEEDQIVMLLGSLPQSYSTLVTVLEARIDDVKLKYVHLALFNEEQKLKGQFGHSAVYHHVINHPQHYWECRRKTSPEN